ncbi:hypothetical protein [uncultured Parasphingopyxis sp.]|uniref:hypothetical protein n=1 Tax=uncultured Parasphingopyxis sp. TaxID=1547918 RepID=UPI00260CFBFE|nr:hypothetical protein [uncultured Parasphingopyxis sp.]
MATADISQPAQKCQRRPSLRELRANRPENVTILPTAQARQEQRNYRFREARIAGRKLRKQHAAYFDYSAPFERKHDKTAATLLSIEPTPAFALARAIIAALTDEQRQSVRDILERGSGETNRQALTTLDTVKLSIGDATALEAALKRGADK